MLRWSFLVAGIAAFAILLSQRSQMMVVLAFGMMFANFATMCIQYDGPNRRANARMTARLGDLHPNSDERQRLETVAIKTTAADRRHPIDTMTVLNLITGVGCIVLFVWGLLISLT